MSDEKNPYELPHADLSVFGPDEGSSGPAAAEPTGNGERGENGNTPTDQFAAQSAESAGTPTEHADAATEHVEAPHGTVRFQDAATTRPRPPSLAEQRARQRATEEAEVEREREIEAGIAEAQRRQTRKRWMIGGGVVVGVAAIIGAWYLFSPDNVTAQCTVDSSSNDNGTIVQDQYCDADYVTSHGGYLSNGVIFYPLPGGGYRQYHYYYGGSGSIGQRATGGSYSEPGNANIKTKSGSTVQRGGFGVTGKSGGSSGGSSGGEEGGSSGHSSGGHSGGS